MAIIFSTGLCHSHIKVVGPSRKLSFVGFPRPEHRAATTLGRDARTRDALTHRAQSAVPSDVEMLDQMLEEMDEAADEAGQPPPSIPMNFNPGTGAISQPQRARGQ